jgi:molybdopterin-guanine dinucleotide biosynthesis protein A
MTDYTYQPCFRVIADEGDEFCFFCKTVLPGLQDKNIRTAVIVRGGKIVRGSALDDFSEADCESTLIISQSDSCKPALISDIFRYADMVFIVGAVSTLETEISSTTFIVKDFLGDSAGAIQYLFDIAQSRLDEKEVWACILIGGKSSRMGKPKHLLPHQNGQSWLERNVELVKEKVTGVAISGGGELPASLQHYPRLQDIPGVQGPLTGLISATRWLPDVSWLVCACDLPAVTPEAIDWLLGDRLPGRWAKVPRLSGQQRGEPLLARYEPQCGPLFEAIGRSGRFSLHRMFANDKIYMEEVPADLEGSWRNVNTPAELQKFRAE